jgi:hypothetical protein
MSQDLVVVAWAAGVEPCQNPRQVSRSVNSTPAACIFPRRRCSLRLVARSSVRDFGEWCRVPARRRRALDDPAECEPYSGRSESLDRRAFSWRASPPCDGKPAAEEMSPQPQVEVRNRSFLGVVSGRTLAFEPIVDSDLSARMKIRRTAAQGRGETMTTMDPIRYAWEECNLATPFPTVLAKGSASAGGSTTASSAEDETNRPLFATVDAAQAALHAFVVGDLRRLAQSLPPAGVEAASGSPGA